MRIIFFIFLFLTQGWSEKTTSVAPINDKNSLPVVKTCSDAKASCPLEQTENNNGDGLLLARLFANS